VRGYSRHTPARLPSGQPPLLCVVVDTEEEFDWSQPFDRDSTSVNSIAAQVLAHERVHDKFGVVPAYVIDWPVASKPEGIAPLKALMDQGRCEIGAHLHPWVSPPYEETVNVFNSFAGNLPPELEFEKISRLTAEIAKNFQRAPVIFKAGRYGLGPSTFEMIEKLGYLVDVSIVPHTSFAHEGGPDFRRFTNQPFFFGAGHPRLLELPVTTAYTGLLRRHGNAVAAATRSNVGRMFRLGGIAARTRMLERIRLSPEGFSGAELVRVMDSLLASGVQVLTLSYHSPSLAPGNTPYVRTRADLDLFLGKISRVFKHFRDRWQGEFVSVSEARTRLLNAGHLEQVPPAKGIQAATAGDA